MLCYIVYKKGGGFMKKSNTQERLKLIMEEKNLRQVDLLNKCMPYCKKYNVRLGRNDISQYVSGKAEPTQIRLSILAEALNVTETWLMGYDVEREPTFQFSSIEKELVTAYRNKPEMQEAVNTLLGISSNSANVYEYPMAARSNSKKIKLSSQDIENLENAKNYSEDE